MKRRRIRYFDFIDGRLMADRNNQVRKKSRLPLELTWALATLSLVLPFLAFVLAAIGVWRILAGMPGGWPLIGLALALQALDLVIDLWLANPRTSQSEDPDLNRRGAQYAGRVGELVSAVEGRRAKMRLGDTVWTVECAKDLPAGAMVRVIGNDGVVLKVEAI